MDDFFADLLDAASPALSVNRIVKTMVFVDVVAIVPSALLAGSGGQGANFDPVMFALVEAAFVVVSGTVAWLLAIRIRRRRATKR